MSEEITGGQQVEATGTVESPGAEAPAVNPAWSAALDGIPDAYASRLTPHFKQWDDNFAKETQKRDEQLKPFRPFIDQGVSAEDLQASHQVLQILRNDPHALLSDLAERLGVSIQEAAEIVEEAQEDEDGTEEYYDPRLDEFEQNQQQVMTWMQQQEQQRITAEANAQVDADVEALIQKYNLPKGPIVGSIIGRALSNGGDLEKGYQEEMQYQQYLAQNNPNNSAPRVLSASGSSGQAPKQDITAMSPAERRKYLAEQVRASQQ